MDPDGGRVDPAVSDVVLSSVSDIRRLGDR
jgi:hypothetical protein